MYISECLWGFPGSSVVKNLPANAGDAGPIPGSGRSRGGENGNPLQYSCLENFMDTGAWQATVHGVTESDTTEWLHFHFSLSCIVEGNGNPLQCSCLENPRDWGAWWAAVYGVAQSWTQLKRLSSSSKAVNYLSGRRQTWRGCAEPAGSPDISDAQFWLMVESHTGDSEAAQWCLHSDTISILSSFYVQLNPLWKIQC